ncbi:MAG: sensor histidine kinase [Sphaerochaeta sp.]|nr:sensor histidine kinase [Sphaerochaeta sp.]
MHSFSFTLKNIYKKINSFVYDKRYFIKLSLIYIGISLSLFVILSIIFENVYTSISRNYIYGQEKLKSTQIANSIEELMQEYVLMSENLASNDDIQQFFKFDNDTVTNKAAQDAIEDYFLFKKGKEEIHLISKIGERTISTGYIPNIYLYKNWGILYDLQHMNGSTMYFSSLYRGLSGDGISLSVATKVKDDSGKVIGYVIVDIYRNTLQNLFNNLLTSQSSIKISNKQNFIRFSNEDTYDEGTLYEPIHESDYVYTFTTSILDGSFSIHYEVKNTFLLHIKSTFQTQFFYLIALSIIISMITALIISSGIRKPIKTLIETMKIVGKGNLDAQITLVKRNDLHELQDEFNKLVRRLKTLQNENIQNEKLLHLAQIEFLQAQIKPHFLYNMMATIKGMISICPPEEVKNAIVILTKILRESYDFSEELKPLKSHLSFIQNYIDMQNYRFPGRFSLSVDVTEDALNTRMPPLLLQPMIENSIIHGFKDKESHCNISIVGYCNDNYLHLSIMDDGIGMSEEKLAIINEYALSEHSPHVGLANVFKRIKYFYDNSSSIHIESTKGKGTTVTCTLQAL